MKSYRQHVLGWQRGARRILLPPLALVLAAACSGSGDDLSGQALGGSVRTPAPEVGQLSVPRVGDGAEQYLKAKPGNVLVVYFDYTACPDVCPTTMADLSAALENLGDDASNVEVAMITIDPDRDSAEILDAYIAHFVEGGYALRTDNPELLRSVAGALGADYSVETTTDGEVEVSHTPLLYALDEDGELLVTWAFGTTPAVVERDLAILLARSRT